MLMQYFVLLVLYCNSVVSGIIRFGILDAEDEEKIVDLVSPVGHRVVTVYIVVLCSVSPGWRGVRGVRGDLQSRGLQLVVSLVSAQHCQSDCTHSRISQLGPQSRQSDQKYLRFFFFSKFCCQLLLQLSLSEVELMARSVQFQIIVFLQKLRQ